MRATQWLRGLLPVGVLWALLVPAGALGFLDVHPNSWYYEAVTYAEQRNMVSGTSKTEFSPQQTMTRGQFITILGRMAGAPSQVSGQSSFSDVEPGKYYSPYVVWATEKGFILADAGTFRPNEGILREEMAVILDAFLADRDLDLPQEGRDSFADEGSIGEGAREAVKRLGRMGILQGDRQGNFKPLSQLTRGEGVTVFLRLGRAMENQEVAQAKAQGAVFPASIALSCDRYYLAMGETAQIQLTFSPSNTSEKAVYYASGNRSILTVDETGLVRGVGQGSSYIEVSTKTGGVETIAFTVTDGPSGRLAYLDSRGFDDRFLAALNQEIIKLVNAERAKVSLSEMVYGAHLQAGASTRASEMRIIGNAKHVRPNGESSRTAFRDVVPKYMQMAECGLVKWLPEARWIGGEELTPSYIAQLAVKTWMGSSEHRALLLRSYEGTVDVACGFALDENAARYYIAMNPYFGPKQ